MLQTVKCPFCNVGDINIIYSPATKKLEKGPWGGSKPAVRSTTEKTEVITEKCPNCSKSKKEIEKVLKHGKEPPNEDVLKRLIEAGIDPSKLK